MGLNKEKTQNEENLENNIELEEDNQEEVLQSEANNLASDKSEADDDIETKDPLQVLQEEVEQLKSKVAEKEDQFLRSQAELDNVRRRARLDAQAREKYRSQNLVTSLIPVIDNFDRALQVTTENEEVKSLLSGVEMVYKGLLEALEAEGVEKIEAAGQQFDPNFHQAVMQVEEVDYDSNVVIEELQAGYILKDRVIRPSMVKVNK